MLANERLKPVKELLEGLERYSMGYTFYLGGGALRDFYFKGILTNIKDWDIFAIPLHPYAVVTLVKPEGLTPLFETTYNLDMHDRGVESLYTGYIKGVPEEVNLIVYNKAPTAQQLAEDFDFNVCQIVMDKNGKVTCSEAFTKSLETKELIQTKGYGKVRMEERAERMKLRLNLN